MKQLLADTIQLQLLLVIIPANVPKIQIFKLYRMQTSQLCSSQAAYSYLSFTLALVLLAIVKVPTNF